MPASQKISQSPGFPAAAKAGYFPHSLDLKKLPISQKLGLIVAVYSVIICSLLILSHFGMGILSDLRVCVMGKEVWAIARRDAVMRLEHYVNDGADADYQIFLKNQAIAVGDRKAFTEIKKDKTDLKIVEAGFIEGANSPEDVPSIARLFERFYGVPYIRESVQAWEHADSLLDDMMRLGSEVHEEVLSGSMTEEKRKAFLARIEAISR